MRRIAACLVATLVLAAITPAKARDELAFIDGFDLYRLFRSNPTTAVGSMDHSMAAFFLVGVADALTGVPQSRTGSCFVVPLSVQRHELEGVVRQYMDRHPQQRHLSAADQAARAFAEAWPCHPADPSASRQQQDGTPTPSWLRSLWHAVKEFLWPDAPTTQFPSPGSG